MERCGKVERAALRFYINNQVILEPILTLHQNMNKRKTRSIKTVYKLPFYLPR